MQGQVFLKGGGGWHFYLSFLHLEITLPFAKLCCTFKEKLFFSTTIISQKSQSKLSKNESENIP